MPRVAKPFCADLTINVYETLYVLYHIQTEKLTKQSDPLLWRVPKWTTTYPPGQNGRQCERRQFQMHFLDSKLCNSDLNFTETCFRKSDWQYPSIVSDNGLSPTRRQVLQVTRVLTLSSQTMFSIMTVNITTQTTTHLHFKITTYWASKCDIVVT